MNNNQREGVKEQAKGWLDTAVANRKDCGDQKKNIEKGVENPGDPTNE